MVQLSARTVVCYVQSELKCFCPGAAGFRRVNARSLFPCVTVLKPRNPLRLQTRQPHIGHKQKKHKFTTTEVRYFKRYENSKMLETWRKEGKGFSNLESVAEW